MNAADLVALRDAARWLCGCDGAPFDAWARSVSDAADELERLRLRAEPEPTGTSRQERLMRYRTEVRAAFPGYDSADVERVARALLAAERGPEVTS